MTFHLQGALQRIKQSLAELLDGETIKRVCHEVGHEWRERLLDPIKTLHLFILQVLHGNTAIANLPHLSAFGFTASAYCQARMRLPLSLLQGLLRRLGGSLRDDVNDAGRWRGHRTFLVDGSSFSMPDAAPLQQHFGQSGMQRAGCGFPTAHLIALFHAGTGLLMDVLANPLRTHDMSQAATLHPKLEKNDLLVGDRGLCSFVHFALALGRGLHALFRAHQRQIIDFTPGRPHALNKRAAKGLPTSRWLRQLGVTDQVVEWSKPAQRPEWMTAAQFAAVMPTLELRELRYRVNRPGFRVDAVTLVTTLLDPVAYPAEALAALYGVRWQVEGHLRDLKQTMKMDVLRSKTVNGVLKELAVYALVYNLVRVVILAAARKQNVAPQRISFIDALRWLASARPGKRLGRLVVNPERPNRCEPRAIKRRPKQYDLLTRPRRELRAELMGAATTGASGAISMTPPTP